MIVKSLSRSGNTSQLLNYIFRYILEKEQKEEQEKAAKSPAFSKEDVSRFMQAFKEGDLNFSALPYMEISAYRDLERELDSAVRIAKTTAIGKELAQREKAHGTDLKNTHLYLTPNYLIAHSKGGERFFKLSNRVLSLNSKHEQKDRTEPFIIRHNLRARSIGGYIREFEKVESLRQHVRSNSPVVYHTILSFGAADKAHVTDEMLHDLANKFIELRGANNLYVGTKHEDRDHVHLHIAMSAVDLAGRSVRISQAKFHELKTELQKYQDERYPELSHSHPEHGKKQKIKNREAEVEKIKNTRTTEKSTLQQVLEAAFNKSNSTDHFLTLLQEQGYTPYHRSGTLTGVSVGSNLKFRFGRLGYGQEKINSLNLAKEREQKELAALRSLRENNIKDRTQERLAALNEMRQEAPVEKDQPESLKSAGDNKDSMEKDEDHAVRSEQSDRVADAKEHDNIDRDDSLAEDERGK